MTPIVRNRIVGSIILLIAAVIILPSILDGEKISYKDEFKTVPERPQFEAVSGNKQFPTKEFEQQMPEPEQMVDEQPIDAEQLAEVERQISTPVAAASTTVVDNDTITVAKLSRPIDFDNPKPKPPASTKPKPRAQAKTEPKVQTVVKQSQFTSSAWVIQLGSFGLKANANALEKKLNDAGFTTFNRPITSSRGRLTKVYVGPELDKKILTNALAKVNRVAGVKGIITTFTVKR